MRPRSCELTDFGPRRRAVTFSPSFAAPAIFSLVRELIELFAECCRFDLSIFELGKRQPGRVAAGRPAMTGMFGVLEEQGKDLARTEP